jgi:DNA-binding transcriptional LysR family regulator
MDVRRLDLNLLLTLRALLEARNVTRAGEMLHLSQPATSAALAKLRRHFNDALLVRDGRELQLTPVAQVLLPLVVEALTQVDRVLAVRSHFDAARSDRRFHITASEYAASVINERLWQHLSSLAPGVSLEYTPTSDVEDIMGELLKRDLFIAPLGYGFPGMHQVLFRDRFVCVLDALHPALAENRDALWLMNELPHVVGRFGDHVATPADRLIECLGVRRREAVCVNGLSALPPLVLGTEMVALVPVRLARAFTAGGRWAAVEIPEALEYPLIEAAYWHPSRKADQALQWLLSVLVDACEGLNDQPDQASIRAADTS